MTTKKRLIRRLGALVLAVSGAVAFAVNALGPGTVKSPALGLAAYDHQRVTWTDCRQGPKDELGAGLHQGARCAQITVPLDYARPEGRTIKIAVSRLPAADPSRRIGT